MLLISYNLLNPTTNVEELNIEYDMIDYLSNNSSILEYIKSNIQNIKDLDKLSRLIMIKKIIHKKKLCYFYRYSTPKILEFEITRFKIKTYGNI